MLLIQFLRSHKASGSIYKLLIGLMLIISFSCKKTELVVNDTPNAEVLHTHTRGTQLPTFQTLNYQILNIYRHDYDAFTQGLELFNGKLYEGTGNYSKSSLRIVDVKTGIVEKKHVMGSSYIFGEGITIFKNQLFQLTWKNNVVYVYNPNDITRVVNTYNWPREGWGITHNENQLIISDGSARLYFVDPTSFAVIKTVTVTGSQGPVSYLNELEFIDGYVFANIYGSDKIIKIDPTNGNIVGSINLANLRYYYNISSNNVLNGIAWNAFSRTMYVTGKNWPYLFEIVLK